MTVEIVYWAGNPNDQKIKAHEIFNAKYIFKKIIVKRVRFLEGW